MVNRKPHVGPILRVSAKCSDLWSHQIIGTDGEVKASYDGYVPSFMPGEHWGDYVMLDIDPYTGRILDWKRWKRTKTLRERVKAVKAKRGKR